MMADVLRGAKPTLKKRGPKTTTGGKRKTRKVKGKGKGKGTRRKGSKSKGTRRKGGKSKKTRPCQSR